MSEVYSRPSEEQFVGAAARYLKPVMPGAARNYGHLGLEREETKKPKTLSAMLAQSPLLGYDTVFALYEQQRQAEPVTIQTRHTNSADDILTIRSEQRAVGFEDNEYLDSLRYFATSRLIDILSAWRQNGRRGRNL